MIKEATSTAIAGMYTSTQPGPGLKNSICSGTPICRATVSTTAAMPNSRIDAAMLDGPRIGLAEQLVGDAVQGR